MGLELEQVEFEVGAPALTELDGSGEAAELDRVDVVVERRAVAPRRLVAARHVGQTQRRAPVQRLLDTNQQESESTAIQFPDQSLDRLVFHPRRFILLVNGLCVF